MASKKEDLLDEVQLGNWNIVQDWVEKLQKELPPEEFEKNYSPIAISIELVKLMGKPGLDLAKEYADNVFPEGVEKDSTFTDGMYSLMRNKSGVPFELEPISKSGPYPRALTPVQKGVGDISFKDRISISLSDIVADFQKKPSWKGWMPPKGPMELYHATAVDNLDSIKAQGLMPFGETSAIKKPAVWMSDKPDFAINHFKNRFPGKKGVLLKLSVDPKVIGIHQSMVGYPNVYVSHETIPANMIIEEIPVSKKSTSLRNVTSENTDVFVGMKDLFKESSESLMLTPRNTELSPQVDWRYPERREPNPTGFRPFMTDSQPGPKLKETTEDSRIFFFGPSFNQNLTKVRSK